MAIRRYLPLYPKYFRKLVERGPPNEQPKPERLGRSRIGLFEPVDGDLALRWKGPVLPESAMTT